jgi:4-aminobutyrate aminotransferase-like enzyme
METFEAGICSKTRFRDRRLPLGRLDVVAQRFQPSRRRVRGKDFTSASNSCATTSQTPDRAAATRVVDMLRDRNILVGMAGPHGNILKIRPPLCFERDHADLLVKTLYDSLATLS